MWRVAALSYVVSKVFMPQVLLCSVCAPQHITPDISGKYHCGTIITSIECILLGAAAVEALLRRSGNLQANNGSAALAAPASEGVASGALHSPVLELSCDGQKLLSVRVQLRTGRLLLRAGDNGAVGHSGNLGQELSPLLRQVRTFSAVPCETLLVTTHTSAYVPPLHSSFLG